MEKILLSRLKYELKDIKNYPQFSLDIDPSNNNLWYINFKGAKDTLYENENFKLKFHFNEHYASKYYFNSIYSLLKVQKLLLLKIFL